MKFVSVLSALALAVLPCQAEKRMFNLTFYSVDQNRSIQYAVHDNMGIGIIRTRVARKIIQRLPLTYLQYHNESLFDVKTVKDYGLNEHSDPIFVHKRKSKATIKIELKEEKERLEKEKKTKKAQEKIVNEALKKAGKALAKDREQKKNKVLAGGTSFQRAHWPDAERKAMTKLEKKFAEIEKILTKKYGTSARINAKLEARRKNNADPAITRRLEGSLRKVEADIANLQKKQLKLHDKIVLLHDTAEQNVDRKAAHDLKVTQASNTTKQAEAMAHGKNATKIGYSANTTSESFPSKYNGTNATLVIAITKNFPSKNIGTKLVQ